MDEIRKKLAELFGKAIVFLSNKNTDKGKIIGFIYLNSNEKIFAIRLGPNGPILDEIIH